MKNNTQLQNPPQTISLGLLITQGKPTPQLSCEVSEHRLNIGASAGVGYAI